MAGRLALAASVVVLTVAATAPVRTGQPGKSDDPMCTKVAIGAETALVNGVTAAFTWSDGGVSWTTDGVADTRKFRVTVKSGSAVDTVWGETGAWQGEDIRSVQACYCPDTSKTTTTTKRPTTTTKAPSTSVLPSSGATTKPTTTTTTKPTTTTAGPSPVTVTEPSTTTEATTTTAATTTTEATTTEATTTTAGTTATTAATTTTGGTTATTAAVTTAGTQAPSAETTTQPTLAVLAAAAAQTELPETGVDSTTLAWFGVALLITGAVLVNRRQPGAHRR